MGEKPGTITVYSTRGGNGKTITSIMLAIAASRSGLKTVIIDADLEAPSLLHLLPTDDIGTSWVDFLDESLDDVLQLPRKSRIQNLDVIYTPSPQVGKNFLGWKSKEWWQQSLKRSMIAEQDLHEAGYDMVILDNQSGTSLNSVNNMVLADASVMVIRPATYGVGAAENFIGEMYRVLRDLKPRKDYYMWNQIQEAKNENEATILSDFLSKWDYKLQQHGLVYGGKIDFNSTLNLGLLGENIRLEDYYGEVDKPISNLFLTIIDQ